MEVYDIKFNKMYKNAYKYSKIKSGIKPCQYTHIELLF